MDEVLIDDVTKQDTKHTVGVCGFEENRFAGVYM